MNSLRYVYHVAIDAFYTFLADDGWAIASHIALSILMALFPFLIVLTSLAGFFGSKELADHAADLFEKHGMTNVIYLRPMDAPASQQQLVYLLAHADRDTAKASWAAFASDPEWQQVAKASQVNGPLTTKVESVFFTPADYSPLK